MASPISVPRDPSKRGELATDTKTPPEKSSILPLTPPASSERPPSGFDLEAALQTFDDCCTGRNGRTSIKLQPRDYEQLTNALGRHPVLGPYTQDKLRFDYDPRSELLSIRMPTPVHEIVANSIANDIYDNIKAFQESPDHAGRFASRIVNVGSSRVFLREDVAEGQPGPPTAALKREPDAQFQHQEAAYPGVVLEVSYSQDGKDLKKLAWDYIQYSNGDIKAVIGIDINYGSAPSTVSLWRPKLVREEGEELDILDVEQEIVYEPFRSPMGEPLNKARNIRLMLSDFATDKLCERLNSSAFSISYERLAEVLGQAESMQRTREHGLGQGVKSDRKTKKRQRPSSSPERLASEDEAQFRLEEDRVKERADADDDDFLPRARRRCHPNR
ncbi:hypothetical protein F5Y12DRAFT_778999 [Xylaria sp. FL1777]|nr:hypothetical protein F5Y12DRAFT_778999 [Xylaria sp. FL1777]